MGPFVDDTDFKTLENALTIANTDIRIKKNGAASAAKNSGGATADGNGGLYAVTWDATDTATVGELSVSIKVAGALVYFCTYTVLEEVVYDSLFLAAAPGYIVDQPVNVTKWAGTTVTTGDIAIKTTLAKTTHITGFNDVSTAQVNTEADTALSDIQLDHLFQLADPTGVVANNSFWAKMSSKGSPAVYTTYDGTTDSQEAIRDRGDAAWITGAGGDPWATAVPGAYGAGTAGNILGNRLDVAVGTRATQTSVDTIGTNVSTLLTRITSTIFSGITSLAQWLGMLAGKQVGNSTARTEMRATGAGGGTFDEVTDSQEALRDRGDAAWITGAGSDPAAIADAVWDEALSGHLTAGSAGAALNGAGSAGDPWTTLLPGSYGAGTAGNIVGNRLDAAVTTRATPAQVRTEADNALIAIHLDHLLAVADPGRSRRQLELLGETAFEERDPELHELREHDGLARGAARQHGRAADRRHLSASRHRGSRDLDQGQRAAHRSGGCL